MNDVARKAKNQYQREWRKKNADKVKAANERYWARKAEEMKRSNNQVKEAEAHENAGN